MSLVSRGDDRRTADGIAGAVHSTDAAPSTTSVLPAADQSLGAVRRSSTGRCGNDPRPDSSCGSCSGGMAGVGSGRSHRNRFSDLTRFPGLAAILPGRGNGAGVGCRRVPVRAGSPARHPSVDLAGYEVVRDVSVALADSRLRCRTIRPARRCAACHGGGRRDRTRSGVVSTDREPGAAIGLARCQEPAKPGARRHARCDCCMFGRCDARAVSIAHGWRYCHLAETGGARYSAGDNRDAAPHR